MKLAVQDNKAVDAEIQKLADGAVYDNYQTHINERQRLTMEIEKAGEDGDERARLMAELNNVDARVKEQLSAQNKEQDKSLQDKLAARRARRNKQIENERDQKKSQLQERISKALDNSNEYMAKKNNMTR